ncbi:MAG: BolA family transcriptional regulator [Simkaniaceae bacterium]|nr:BolA family transcriptional regulator [Simkaniaceae bacterium]
MAIDSEKLKTLLEHAFPDATFDLDDMLGDADHYGLTITSSAFEGLNRVKRHQAVYKALGNLMGNELHALSIRAYTPEEKPEEKLVKKDEK